MNILHANKPFPDYVPRLLFLPRLLSFTLPLFLPRLLSFTLPLFHVSLPLFFWRSRRKARMKGFAQDRVLHITYDAPTDIPPPLLQLADDYEGAIPHRVGWNFPLTPSARRIVSALFPSLTLPSDSDYLIVYPVKDIQTKKHELLHARYAMDPMYRYQVRALWASLSLAHQTKALSILRHLQYPDREELLLDEFQAYYFTEPSRFFGIPVYSLPRVPQGLPSSLKKKRK